MTNITVKKTLYSIGSFTRTQHPITPYPQFPCATPPSTCDPSMQQCAHEPITLIEYKNKHLFDPVKDPWWDFFIRKSGGLQYNNF